MVKWNPNPIAFCIASYGGDDSNWRRNGRLTLSLLVSFSLPPSSCFSSKESMFVVHTQHRIKHSLSFPSTKGEGAVMELSHAAAMQWKVHLLITERIHIIHSEAIFRSYTKWGGVSPCSCKVRGQWLTENMQCRFPIHQKPKGWIRAFSSIPLWSFCLKPCPCVAMYLLFFLIKHVFCHPNDKVQIENAVVKQ